MSVERGRPTTPQGSTTLNPATWETTIQTDNTSGTIQPDRIAIPVSRNTSTSRSISPHGIHINIDEATSDEDDTHFTLKKSIDPSKFSHLFRIRPRLVATNYATWSTTVMRALQTVSLHIYLDSNFLPPARPNTTTRHHRTCWNKANCFVCSVLTASMSEEVQNQVGHLTTASAMWTEARQLYAGTTVTDWTMTITSLVTTRYTDGEDLNAHMIKMKGY